MAQQNILPNNPPIVWSTVDEAFQKINANFTELYLSIGGNGVDLTQLASSIIPDSDQVRDLGSPTKRWRDLYLSASSLYLGTAIITAGQLGTVNLPLGSTVGGELIRNPEESNFKTIKVAGQSDVVANNFEGILNISGTGIGITTNPNTDTVNFSNSGVTSLLTGTGVSADRTTGNVTITNTGVIGLTAGTGISVNNPTGTITIANTGVTQLVSGSGIVLDGSSGVVTVTNSAPNIAQNVYRFLAVSGQPVLDPSGPTSTLNIITGSGISLISEPLSNTLTFNNTGVLSLSVDDGFTINSGTGIINLGIPQVLSRDIIGNVNGSVFSDDSTLLIDGTGGRIVGPLFSSDGTNSIIMNSISGLQIASTGLIDIQGAAGAQIGIGAGTSGDVYIGNGSNSIIVDGTLLTSLIDTDDSSSLAIVPSVVFRSDVTVENDLIVRNLLTVQGNILGYTSTATLKNIVAASTNFADFQTRIAAL
jgi:hypothetical protein